MMHVFRDRLEAGELLSLKLHEYNKAHAAVVVAIPRGGVVVGDVLARNLNLPLTAIVVKKLGAPENPELAIGAVCADGVTFVDSEMTVRLGVSDKYLKEEIESKKKEAQKRLQTLTFGHKLPSLLGKTAILTDDGIATGSTIEAAISCLREQKIKKIILAIPVAARDTITRLEKLVDKIVVLEEPEYFGSVGQFYQSFDQVEDEEVKRLL